MVYLIVFITLIFLAAKGYFGKKTSTYVEQSIDAVRFNSLRMLICVLIGFALVFAEDAQDFLLPEGKMLAICALAGFSNAAFLICWMLAVRKNPMVSVDVSLTLGSLIPAILCALLFSEPLSLPKMIGFGLIIAATIILSGYHKKTVKNEKRFLGILLLIAAVVGEGMTNFSQQLYKHSYTEGGARADGIFYPKTIYHFYTYVFSALVLLIVLIGYRLYLHHKGATAPSDESQPKRARTLSFSIVVHIFLMALCLFAANYFQTVATNDYGMPSQILYPILKGGSLIAVNFTAMIFFGEKITRRSILGSLVALLGIIFMNVL